MTTDKEIRDRAEELVVINGLTLEEAAEETGVSTWTIKRWSTDGRWKAKQREYRNAEAEIRRYTRLARLNFIKDIVTSLDPQKSYAFDALTKAQKSMSLNLEAPEPNYEGVEIKTPQEAIAALEEAIKLKTYKMLANPDAINLDAIKDMKKAMELIDQMRAESEKITGSEKDKDRLLTRDEIRDIREQLL